jgi:hypothetical protein
MLIRSFAALFHSKYLHPICDQLGITLKTGMVLYSPKYDLYITLAMDVRCRDIYRVF